MYALYIPSLCFYQKANNTFTYNKTNSILVLCHPVPHLCIQGKKTEEIVSEKAHTVDTYRQTRT